MSESEEELDEFEEQFRLERLEQERRSRCSNIEHGATRTDPDGTVYEWDADKLAYFPMIDQNFIAQYQMSYGIYPVPDEKKDEPLKDEPPKDEPPKPAADKTTDWSTYFSYVMKYSTEHGKYPEEMTKEHIEYYNYLYNYYYGNTASNEAITNNEEKREKDKLNKTKEHKEGENLNEKNLDGDEKAEKDKESESEKTEGNEVGEKVEGESRQGVKEETAEEKAHREYYEYYQNYYAGYAGDEVDTTVDSDQQEFDEWAYHNYYHGGGEEEAEAADGTTAEDDKDTEDEAEEEKEKNKKKRKLEPKKPDAWFEIEVAKNTNVYVAGLPDDITDDEFRELMGKCGMIMLDPRGRDHKLKLYRNADGKPKGDGLCCYMKSESVDLAVQMLDEYDVRGHRISVEVAQFQMKGKFDAKKRKKLSNKERKNLKKQQEKMLDWRPSKPIGYRPKHERIIIVKNAFDCKDFEADPKKIQTLREDLRAQCLNFGTVKKIIVYDRHQEGLVSVAFDEVPEADLAIESLNGRFFNRRQITAESWDGKTKYDVKETDVEREARLKHWDVFLEDGGEDKDSKKEEKKDDKKGQGWKAKKWKNEKAKKGATTGKQSNKMESGSASDAANRGNVGCPSAERCSGEGEAADVKTGPTTISISVSQETADGDTVEAMDSESAPTEVATSGVVVDEAAMET